MALLQVKMDDKLKKAIDEKANLYGVPSSTLVRIVLVETFLLEDGLGNVFNADRDNQGKGVKIDDIIAAL